MFGCVCSPFSIFQPHTSTTIVLSPLLGKPSEPTLHWWQQLPWAHSAPSFREQVLASQQGLLHSWKTARCSRVYKADVQDKNVPEHQSVRLTLICSHAQWIMCKLGNSFPPTICSWYPACAELQCCIIISSVGLTEYYRLCSLHLMNLGCLFQLLFVLLVRVWIWRCKYSTKRSSIFIKNGAIGEANLYMELQHLRALFLFFFKGSFRHFGSTVDYTIHDFWDVLYYAL